MNRKLSLSISGLAAILFLWSTFRLFQLTENQELWGYLPLIQFTGFYGMIFFLLEKTVFRWGGTLRLAGLASISAILLSLGFPPFPLAPLLFLAFVPLLWVEKTFAEKGLQITKLLLFSFHTFLLWNIWTTYWITNTAYVAGVFANIANAFLMSIPFVLFHYLKYRLGEKWGIVAFISCWITFEFLHMRWELYWPWLTLGNGLSMFSPLIQWYEYSGVLGGTGWILLINYGVFTILRNWKSFSITPLLWTVAALLIPIGLSLFLYFSHQEQGESIEVVSVQPNYEPHYEKFQIPLSAQLSRFLELSRENLTSNTDYLILPETSFNQVDMNNIRNSVMYNGLRKLQNDFPDLRIVIGLGGYRIISDTTEFDLPTTRMSTDANGREMHYEVYNCAVQIDPTGDIQEYYKELFVPGAEFFPFRRILFFLQPVIDQLGGTLEGYRTRSSQALFLSSKATIAPAICYESIFGEFISRFIRKGADVIFIMTNDGWWDNTAGHLQHAYFGRLRSIEMRRSIARSANMGTCYFTNQRGDMLQPTKYGIPGSIVTTLHLNQERTFYSVWGDIVGRLALFLTVFLLIIAVIRNRVSRKQNTSVLISNSSNKINPK